jgi:hypothetical protein
VRTEVPAAGVGSIGASAVVVRLRHLRTVIRSRFCTHNA